MDPLYRLLIPLFVVIAVSGAAVFAQGLASLGGKIAAVIFALTVLAFLYCVLCKALVSPFKRSAIN